LSVWWPSYATSTFSVRQPNLLIRYWKRKMKKEMRETRSARVFLWLDRSEEVKYLLRWDGYLLRRGTDAGGQHAPHNGRSKGWFSVYPWLPESRFSEAKIFSNFDFLSVSQTSKIKLKNVVGIYDTNIEYLDDYFGIQINHILNNAWLKKFSSLTYFNKKWPKYKKPRKPSTSCSLFCNRYLCAPVSQFQSSFIDWWL
jgi:hypothetical protein